MGRLTKEEIEKIRNKKYRRQVELYVHTEEEAIEFVNEVGFCFLFPVKKLELPNLWEAMCSHPSSYCDWNDPIAQLIWGIGDKLGWRDSLPKSKKIFYGKVLIQKPTLVSLAYFPYFYAIIGNQDYLEEYNKGNMSRTAKIIYEYLMQRGPTATHILRGFIGMRGKENESKFKRALLELQSGLKIAKVDAIPGRCIDIWDIFPRWMPEMISKAEKISEEEAMENITLKYLETVVISTPANINKLFRWDMSKVNWVLTLLNRKRVVTSEVEIEGLCRKGVMLRV